MPDVLNTTFTPNSLLKSSKIWLKKKKLYEFQVFFYQCEKKESAEA